MFGTNKLLLKLNIDWAPRIRTRGQITGYLNLFFKPLSLNIISKLTKIGLFVKGIP